jgi:hypothetical protein
MKLAIYKSIASEFSNRERTVNNYFSSTSQNWEDEYLSLLVILSRSWQARCPYSPGPIYPTDSLKPYTVHGFPINFPMLVWEFGDLDNALSWIR